MPHYTPAALPKRRDFEGLHSSDDLARMLLSYFMAYAVEAGITNVPLDKKTIFISPWTARRIGRIGLFNRYGMEVPLRVWSLPMTFWFAVDEAGNAFEYGSEGIATQLTFKKLRTLPASELKCMLRNCNPFEEDYDN